jgi:hypothetical protein
MQEQIPQQDSQQDNSQFPAPIRKPLDKKWVAIAICFFVLVITSGGYGITRKMVSDAPSTGSNYSPTEQFGKTGYKRNGNDIIFFDTRIEGADARTFAVLGLQEESSHYAKDKSNVYYAGKVIRNADVASFVVVEDSSTGRGGFGYAKDKSHIFRGETMLTVDIDVSSFAVVSSGMIKDSKRVYMQDYYKDTLDYILLPGADAPTFQSIGLCGCVEVSCSFYYKDKNNIFVGDKPLSSIDVGSFQYFGIYSVQQGMPYSVSYSKDRNTVYGSCGDILKDADQASFVDLKGGYAKDKNKLWYLGSVLPGADRETFQSIAPGYGKDKVDVYYEGARIQGADPNTFIIVKKGAPLNGTYGVYAKDKSYVYFDGEIVKGANPMECAAESMEGCLPK